MAISNDVMPRIFKASVLALGLIEVTHDTVKFLDVGLVLMILYYFPIGVALISHSQGKICINFEK